LPSTYHAAAAVASAVVLPVIVEVSVARVLATDPLVPALMAAVAVTKTAAVLDLIDYAIEFNLVFSVWSSFLVSYNPLAVFDDDKRPAVFANSVL
jgi:hypothetical protein